MNRQSSTLHHAVFRNESTEFNVTPRSFGMNRQSYTGDPMKSLSGNSVRKRNKRNTIKCSLLGRYYARSTACQLSILQPLKSFIIYTFTIKKMNLITLEIRNSQNLSVGCQCFFIGLSCSIPAVVFYFLLFLLFVYIGWYSGAGARPSTAPGLGLPGILQTCG